MANKIYRDERERELDKIGWRGIILRGKDKKG